VAISRAIQKPIERWLNREPPEQCVTLALVCAGMTESNVAAWTREQFDKVLVGDFASDLVSAAEDHAQGIGRESRYFLRWLNDEGATVLSYMWRAGEGLNLNMDGSAESQIAQLQRHVEAMARVTTSGMNTLLEHYQEALQAQSARIASLEQVRDAFELERLQKAVEAEGVEKPAEVTQLDKLVKTIEGIDRISTAIAKVAPATPATTKTKKAAAVNDAPKAAE
jgi:hypothetical protein